MSEDTTRREGVPDGPDRRQFLNRFGGGTAATIAAGAFGLPSWAVPTAEAEDIGRPTGPKRAVDAMKLRTDAAHRERKVPIPAHPDNEDEERFPSRVGNYSKGLRHNSLGEVDPAAYDALRAAIESGRFDDIEALRPHLGCADPARQMALVNPQHAHSFDLMGTDSAQLVLPPAPAFDSAERAAEMAELYWMSLLRDVSFDAYAADATAQQAANDLSNLPGFKGPRDANGRVTTQTLFRDPFPGCTVGPYLSQFLIRPVAIGAQRVDARIEPRAPGVDFLTDFASWLQAQNGCDSGRIVAPSAATPPRFMRDGRDLGFYVQIDLLYQAYFVAMLVLTSGIADETDPTRILRFPLNPSNPYGAQGATGVQAGFGSFGNPYISTAAVLPSVKALGAVWFQKWRVHRNLRPEAFGGRVEVRRAGRASYPIHADLLKRSTVLPRILARFGSHLLPQAFPDGAPLHPSYGSGHATVAGACITMLKAMFNGDAAFPNPRVINPADGGRTTVPYTGPDRDRMTVAGELNKLASNIAQGRNHAGVHWRSDATESIRLGERVAISILSDYFGLSGEPFGGCRLTKLDGTRVTIRDDPHV